MKAKVLKALKKCCDGKDYIPLSNIYYFDGALYASDSYEIVRVSFDHEIYYNQTFQLDWDAIEAMKPNDEVEPERYLKEPEGLVPSMPKLFEQGAQNYDGNVRWYCSPKLLKKVLGVFEAAGADVSLDDMTPYFCLNGHKDKIHIEARVMEKRFVY